MQITFSLEAQQEFIEAERYYNHQVHNLGNVFREEIIQALSRIRAWPSSCPVELKSIRRLTLSRFPYKLLYSIETDHIYIIAIAHQHRAPDYWINRLN